MKKYRRTASDMLRVLTIAFLCMLHLPMAQAQSLEQWVTWGDAAADQGEHYGASRFYAGALRAAPGRMELQWKLAEAARLSNQYDVAAEHYDMVYRKDRGRTHPDALRWAAEMQMSLGEYEAAKASWERIASREQDSTSFLARRAAQGIASCAFARKSMNEGRDVEIEHLPMPINTFDSEFGARFDPQGRLLFSSLRGELNKHGEVLDTSQYFVAIYHVDTAGGDGTVPEPLPPPINGVGHNANGTWDSSGQHFYFTRCDTTGPCRIHVSKFSNGEYSEPMLVEGIGMDELSTQPMVASIDGRELLHFVSDRAGGEGGTDIWVADLKGVDVHHVRPLGTPVNSPGNEATPFVDSERRLLYFSSDWHVGMGGYDIFSSELLDNGHGIPQNWGHPLNGPANELYPAIEPATGMFWFTSNREGSFAAKGETCCNDLYRFPPTAEMELPEPPLAEEPGEPTDPAGTPSPLPVGPVEVRLASPIRLFFHNDEPGRRSLDTTTTLDYERTYRDYLALRDEYEDQRPERDSAAIGAFFEDEVMHGAMRLKELVGDVLAALEQGRSVELTVRGHASPLAANEYNRRLSLRRIHSLENHLRNCLDGRLAKYLDDLAGNGATLTIVPMPFGEEKAASGVSDRVDETRLSIYSVGAARERRIEIVEARTLGTLPQLAPETDSASLAQEVGALRQGEDRTFDFKVTNPGNAPLHLVGSKADCGCTAAAFTDPVIPPGGERIVQVNFNGRAPVGPLIRNVDIETDGEPAMIRLTIIGTVIP